MMGEIVGFSGVDCAGKSTQIERVRARLVAKGCTTHVFWHRPGYSRELDALRAIVRRIRPQAIPRATSVESGARERVFDRPKVRISWVAMALADLLAQYGARLRHLQSSHDVVLCDRTLLDARFDFLLRFPDLARLWSPPVRGIRSLMPSIAPHFLLVVDRDEMIRRQALKNEPFPDTPEIRDARHALYLEAAHDDRLTAVDASRSIDAVHEHIWTVLGQHGVCDGPA